MASMEPMEPEPWGDAASIIVLLMNVDAKLDEMGADIRVVRSLLEDEDEEEEDD